MHHTPPMAKVEGSKRSTLLEAATQNNARATANEIKPTIFMRCTHFEEKIEAWQHN